MRAHLSWFLLLAVPVAGAAAPPLAPPRPLNGPLRVTARRPAATGWARGKCGWQNGDGLNTTAAATADIPTRFGLGVNANETPNAEFPRPQLVRPGAAPSPSSAVNLTRLRDRGGAGQWASLNGLWEWEPAPAPDGGSAATATPPFGRTLNRSIMVPFPVESCLSGIGVDSSNRDSMWMWYRLVFDVHAGNSGRTVLHFGAVDWQATVYLNGHALGSHSGGYDAFSFDITDRLVPGGNELILLVYDPTDTGAQPEGKQKLGAISNPGWPPLNYANGTHSKWFALWGIVYTPSSGIWQSVFLESVPATHIEAVTINQASQTAVELTVTTNTAAAAAVSVVVLDGGAVAVASGTGVVGAAIVIKVPSAKLWSPDSPHLYDLKISLGGDGGDVVYSYFGLRTFALTANPTVPASPVMNDTDLSAPDIEPCRSMPGTGCPGIAGLNASIDACKAKCSATPGCKAYVWEPNTAACGHPGGNSTCWIKGPLTGPVSPGRPCRTSQLMPRMGPSVPLLNGKYTFLTGTLDQSWWPDGLYTAPSDAALEYDLTATKKVGFNAIRLHQKVNPERWYYHADRHGLVVLQDVPEKYGGSTNATVPLYIDGLKALIGGPRGNHPCIVQWEPFNEGDMFDLFNNTHGQFDTRGYTYKSIVALIRALDSNHRLVDVMSGGPANAFGIGDVNDDHDYTDPRSVPVAPGRYGMVGEYSNVAAFLPGHEWQPGRCHAMKPMNTTAEQTDYLIKTLAEIEAVVGAVSASVYTQTTDVEDECDGWLSYDRVEKFDANQTKWVVAAQQRIQAAARQYGPIGAPI